MDRVKGKGKKKAPIKEEITSESEPAYSDTELESELEMPHKDDSRRKPKKAPRPKPRTVAQHGVTGDEESGTELAASKARETGTKVAPHMQLLLSATYHLGFSSITRPAISNYSPSCYNMYSMIFMISETISENTYLSEMYPGYFSVAMYTYFGFVYFYQILRAKDAIGLGQLSREERRVLRHINSIGMPEAWPIPAPLIEFVRSLGYYKSSDPTFSFVAPRFPDFSQLTSGSTANQGLTRFHEVAGLQRVPPLPAYITFLRNFGTNAAQFRSATGWVPTNQANGRLDATHTFLGIADSSSTSNPFQALAFNGGWLQPTEGELRVGPAPASVKRNVIRRWGITEITGNITGIEDFTQLKDGVNTTWIRHLCAMMNVVCRFFPGSSNLSMIDPVSHLGNLTLVTADVGELRVPKDHIWYRGRQGWDFDYQGYDDTDEGRLLARVGIATGARMDFRTGVIPVGSTDALYSGPFFLDDTTSPDTERHAAFRFTGHTASDPTGRFSEQLTALYEPSGKHGGN